MLKRSTSLLFVVLGLVAFVADHTAMAQDHKAEGNGPSLHLGKVEESEAKSQLGDPNFGYVSQLGSFVATKDAHARGQIVVHNYPNTHEIALGRTHLTYEGTKRLGNVDGWVFKTEWDGKAYPSKVFFSAEKVYFGGGINAHIAADYREGTGWAWKLHPMRQMELVKHTDAK